MAYNYLDNVGLQHLITSIKSLLAGKADSDHTHASATASAAGFMSASDKTKLDNLDSTISTAISDALAAYDNADTTAY